MITYLQSIREWNKLQPPDIRCSCSAWFPTGPAIAFKLAQPLLQSAYISRMSRGVGPQLAERYHITTSYWWPDYKCASASAWRFRSGRHVMPTSSTASQRLVHPLCHSSSLWSWSTYQPGGTLHELTDGSIRNRSFLLLASTIGRGISGFIEGL
jgi:hypothetical protein